MIRRRLAVSALAAALALAVAACKHDASPPVTLGSDAAVASGAAGRAPAGSGSGSAAPLYRTDATPDTFDARVAGTGKTYLVVSESVQASNAGREILAKGGNAADAVVATAFALAVTHPQAGNIAGGGFAIVHRGSGGGSGSGAVADDALDFRETAPAAATPDMYLDAAGSASQDRLVGPRASATPGAVAGLAALHARYGRLPWREVVAPAIALARDGFTIEPSTAQSIAKDAKTLARFPASAALWLPGGNPLAEGAKLQIPELAAVLQRIADHGAAGFYQGPTAQLIVDEMKRGGGLITAADLAGYHAEWRAPLRVSYRGYDLLAMPPPSSGGVVVALTANMLRSTDVAALGWHTTAHVHQLVEVWRRAFAARNDLLGDPSFVPNMALGSGAGAGSGSGSGSGSPTLAQLVSTAYADRLASTITARATPSREVHQLVDGTHTTNLAVVDGHGMAVVITTTINTSFGNGVTVTGGGFVLNNEMDDFASKPGSPNVYGLVQGTANKIEPGKRMLSSMSPTIVLDDHAAVFAVVGAGGGPRIITAVWQTLSNLIDFHLPVAVAVGRARFHHQDLPDKVFVEARSLSEPTATALRDLGYVEDWSNPTFAFGGVTAIARTPDGWAGTADPRRGGGTAGD